jgi:energy-coupling factor transporter ATP-binding protein EcfA2
MLDPITILSFAANVTQLVATSAQIVCKSHRIYKSADGLISEHQRIEDLTNNFVVLQSSIKCALRSMSAIGPLKENDQAIYGVVLASDEMADKLLKKLNAIKVQGSGRAWKSLRQALKSVWAQTEVDAMAVRLSDLRGLLQSRLIVCIRYASVWRTSCRPFLSSNQLFPRDSILSGSIRSEERFEKLDESAKLLYEAIKNDRDICQDQFVSLQTVLSQQLGQISTAYMEINQKVNTALERIERLHAKTLSQLNEKDLTHGSKSHEKAVQAALLRSISYPEIHSRGQSIATAHEQTYKWVFEESHDQQHLWSNLNTWFRSQGRIYWVNGKAASGKSTLMKFVAQHSETERALRDWAGSDRLVIAQFFFWNTGTTMQKSQAGLLGSLLFQAVKQHPFLMQVAMPELQQALSTVDQRLLPFLGDSWYSWSFAELRDSFKRICNPSQIKVRMCLFVDGLDEFAGNSDDLVQTFRDISTCPWIKVCVSSRPWPIFELEYGECPKLRLQDLTGQDIKKYVRNKLGEHKRGRQLEKQDPPFFDLLTNETLKKSSGVFLWVVFAVRTLRMGLTNYDKVPDLLRRLRDLPPELEDLYLSILQRIEPPFYREQASMLLQIVYRTQAPLSVLELSFATEEYASVLFETPIEPIDSFSKSRRIDEIEKRWNSRCLGLLKVQTCVLFHLTISLSPVCSSSSF